MCARNKTFVSFLQSFETTTDFTYVLQNKTGTNVVRCLTTQLPHLTSNWLSPEKTNNNNNSNINWLLLLLEIHKLLEKLVPPVLWNAQVGFPHRCLGISIHTRTHTHIHAHSHREREGERERQRQFDAQCIQIELILVCKIFRH